MNEQNQWIRLVGRESRGKADNTVRLERVGLPRNGFELAPRDVLRPRIEVGEASGLSVGRVHDVELRRPVRSRRRESDYRPFGSYGDVISERPIHHEIARVEA